MRRCSSCGEENSERARFCQTCAPSLTEHEPGGVRCKRKGIVLWDARARDRSPSLAGG